MPVSPPRFEELTACEPRGTDSDGANLTAALSQVGELTASEPRGTDSDGETQAVRHRVWGIDSACWGSNVRLTAPGRKPETQQPDHLGFESLQDGFAGSDPGRQEGVRRLQSLASRLKALAVRSEP
jgi:hypothetical protein